MILTESSIFLNRSSLPGFTKLRNGQNVAKWKYLYAKFTEMELLKCINVAKNLVYFDGTQGRNM